MTQYILRRLLYAIPTLLVIITLTFFGMRIAPGGPFASEKAIPPQIIANLERYYGLDKPLPEQYARYLLNVVRGDLGPSFRYPDRTVADQIFGIVRAPENAGPAEWLAARVQGLWDSNFGTSVKLGLTALLLALLIGVPAGLIGALNQNQLPDYFALFIALVGASIPNFVLGPLLMLAFAIKLGWLPVAGWGDLPHLILPAVALCFAPAAFIARLTRAGALEVIRQDFVRTARAKGLRESVVLGRHVLKLSLLPLVSYLGPAAAALMTGSIVIERIFQVPGIGRYFIESALNRDYTMVMGTVLVYSVLLIALNLVVDVLYAFLDPRIRYS